MSGAAVSAWRRVRFRLARFVEFRRIHAELRRRAVQAYEEEQLTYADERITMGPGSYGRPRMLTYPGDRGRARVGNYTSIARDVILRDAGDHRVDWVTTFPFRARFELEGAYADGHPLDRGDVVIGSDVWIGAGARIRSGVTVGHGAVVAAYSVVTHDVRPYAIVAGAPAREVRRRFSDEQIEALLSIAWWEWPEHRILRCVPQLCSGAIDEFIEQHRR